MCSHDLVLVAEVGTLIQRLRRAWPRRRREARTCPLGWAATQPGAALERGLAVALAPALVGVASLRLFPDWPWWRLTSPPALLAGTVAAMAAWSAGVHLALRRAGRSPAEVGSVVLRSVRACTASLFVVESLLWLREPYLERTAHAWLLAAGLTGGAVAAAVSAWLGMGVASLVARLRPAHEGTVRE